MRDQNKWADYLLSVNPEVAILLNMFDTEEAFTRLLPADMLLSIRKLKAGYSVEVFRHWCATGDWVWSDKANSDYIRGWE